MHNIDDYVREYDYFKEVINEKYLKTQDGGLSCVSKLKRYRLPCWILPEFKDTSIAHMLAINGIAPFAGHPGGIFYEEEGTFSVYLEHRIFFQDGWWNALQANIASVNLDSGYVSLHRNVTVQGSVKSAARKTVTFSKKISIADDAAMITFEEVSGMVDGKTRKLQFHSDNMKKSLKDVKEISLTPEIVHINKKSPYLKKKSLKVNPTNIDQNGHVNYAYYISLLMNTVCEGNAHSVKELLIQYKGEAYNGDIIEIYVWDITDNCRSCLISKGEKDLIVGKAIIYQSDLSKL